MGHSSLLLMEWNIIKLYIYNDWIWKEIKKDRDNSVQQDYHTPEIIALKIVSQLYLHREYPMHSKLSLKHLTHRWEIEYSLLCVTTVSINKFQPKKHIKIHQQMILIMGRNGACLKTTKIRITFKCIRTKSRKLQNIIYIKSKKIRNKRNN